MFSQHLSKVSRKIGLDFEYLFKGGALLTVTQVTSALIGLGMTAAFANLIPQETYGTYRYLLSIYGLFAIATLPGIDTAVTQSVMNGNDRSLIEGYKKKIQWGFTASCGSLAYGAYQFFFQGNKELGYLLGMLAFSIPFIEAGTVGVSFLNGKKLFRTWAATDVLSQLFSAAVMFGTIILTSNIYWIAISYFIPLVIARTYTIFFIRKRHVESAASDAGLLGYSKSLTAFQVLTRIIGSIDQVVLFHFLGPVQVALFAIAQAIPMRIQSTLRIIGTLAFPKFANHNPEKAAEIILKKSLPFAALILTGCFVYIIIAPFIFSVILPQYAASMVFSQVIIFYCVSAITYPFASMLFAYKMLRETYIVTGATFLTKVITLVILVPKIGIWGAVAGILVSSTVNMLVTFFILRKVATGSILANQGT